MGKDKAKLKMAVYWGAACGGCCVSVLDVHETLFTVIEHADLVFWPIALDFKYRDVEEMPDQVIDITLFNGAVRTAKMNTWHTCCGRNQSYSSPMAPVPIWEVYPGWLTFRTGKPFSDASMKKVNRLSIRIK